MVDLPLHASKGGFTCAGFLTVSILLSTTPGIPRGSRHYSLWYGRDCRICYVLKRTGLLIYPRECPNIPATTHTDFCAGTATLTTITPKSNVVATAEASLANVNIKENTPLRIGAWI